MQLFGKWFCAHLSMHQHHTAFLTTLAIQVQHNLGNTRTTQPLPPVDLLLTTKCSCLNTLHMVADNKRLAQAYGVCTESHMELNIVS